jgi:hypothetical protein
MTSPWPNILARRIHSTGHATPFLGLELDRGGPPPWSLVRLFPHPTMTALASTLGNSGLTVELDEIQAAVHGRKFASVDRRPLDPPPVNVRMFLVCRSQRIDQILRMRVFDVVMDPSSGVSSKAEVLDYSYVLLVIFRLSVNGTKICTSRGNNLLCRTTGVSGRGGLHRDSSKRHRKLSIRPDAGYARLRAKHVPRYRP